MQMFRLNGFSRATFDWVPPTDIDHASAPRLWREWAQHETAKRALAVSYLHDCCHCIYFNLRPTYDTTDFDMRLPCEDALWTASTADEWLQLLRQPSRYGSIQERLRGPMLRATYDKLAEPESVSATPLVLNPWSHNILIHVALRQFFEEFLEARLPEIGTPRASSPSRRDTQYISDERIAELQLIMHNWLQSWLHSPESPTYNAREPRFMNQALPYYWFSQVAILAYQERLPPFCTSTTFVVSGEAKFRLMKKWERHIRKFLRRGGTEPTVFLDDLIKTRMRKWDSSGLVEDAEEDPDGRMRQAASTMRRVACTRAMGGSGDYYYYSANVRRGVDVTVDERGEHRALKQACPSRMWASVIHLHLTPVGVPASAALAQDVGQGLQVVTARRCGGFSHWQSANGGRALPVICTFCTVAGCARSRARHRGSDDIQGIPLWDMSLTPLAQLVCRLGLRPQLEIPWHAFASKRSFTDYHETLHAIVLKAPESLEWMCLESRRWSLFDSGVLGLSGVREISFFWALRLAQLLSPKLPTFSVPAATNVYVYNRDYALRSGRPHSVLVLASASASREFLHAESIAVTVA
ncbi:predicted protein [Postia placenta Mad-698-R]|nr:predicted protein [Postia placenta Mad-698-R]